MCLFLPLSPAHFLVHTVEADSSTLQFEIVLFVMSVFDWKIMSLVAGR